MAEDYEQQLKGMPMVEVHAHLNGSIPSSAIAHLVEIKSKEPGNEDLRSFELPGPDSRFDIHTFFPLFGKFIYRLTSDVDSIRYATSSVLSYFATQNVVYLELRTTPRPVPTLNDYLNAVLEAFKAHDQEKMRAKLILSVDRRHSKAMAEDVVNLAIVNREWVVGIDLCGDPTQGDVREFVPAFAKAKENGLKVTVHLGEIESQLESQALDFDLKPDRLGHATFLSPTTQALILKERIPIEICLSSNLICQTVASLDVHHLKWALANDVPFIICTDDVLIFRNSPIKDYGMALQICSSLKKLVEQVERGFEKGMFGNEDDKKWVLGKYDEWKRKVAIP